MFYLYNNPSWIWAASEDLRKARTLKKSTHYTVVQNFTEERAEGLFNWWESDKVGTFREVE